VGTSSHQHFTPCPAAILLFFALRELTASGDAVAGIGDAGRDQRYGYTWLALGERVCAALFAVHPLRVESVAWVSERKDVLSGVFFMLTLWAYARYARGNVRFFFWYMTVTVLFPLGLMCKPTLVTLPFVWCCWITGPWAEFAVFLQPSRGNGECLSRRNTWSWL